MFKSKLWNYRHWNEKKFYENDGSIETTKPFTTILIGEFAQFAHPNCQCLIKNRKDFIFASLVFTPLTNQLHRSTGSIVCSFSFTRFRLHISTLAHGALLMRSIPIGDMINHKNKWQQHHTDKVKSRSNGNSGILFCAYV